MITTDLSYNTGDYVIDDEAEKIEDAMQDIMEDDGSDLDLVAELSDEDYDEYEYDDEELDYDEDFIEYEI